MKSGVMCQTTGQSYRSKSRHSEYFVSKCYWCFWQYPIHVGGWRKEKQWKERKVGLEKGEQQSKTCIDQYVPVAKGRHYQSALCMGHTHKKCPFHVKVPFPFSQILYHALFDSWGETLHTDP